MPQQERYQPKLKLLPFVIKAMLYAKYASPRPAPAPVAHSSGTASKVAEALNAE